MQIQTFSVVVGGTACNAKCPFCVSKMTGNDCDLGKQTSANLFKQINWHRFHIACKLAKQSQCTTAMLTGKGEPLLWPDMVDDYIQKLHQYDFPIIELQTNGLLFVDKNPYDESWNETLVRWGLNGLSTVALSVVDVNPETNRQIYLPHKKSYPSLAKRIELLHVSGLSVRLVVTMNQFGIHSPEDIERVVKFAKKHGVEQVTFTPVNSPGNSDDEEAASWVNKYRCTAEQLGEISKWLHYHGTPIMTLDHGATVFDLFGQNVCLSNCLQKEETKLSQMRNLIWLNNHLYHRWDYPGSIIL